jgi:excisionase family DNA binding protein
MPGAFVTIHEAAARLHVSYGTIRNAIRAGRLSAYRFGSTFRIRPEDLAAYVESCRVEQVPRPIKPPESNAGTGGSPFKYLDGQRSLDAWRRQGAAVDPPGGRSAPSSGSSRGPSVPPGSSNPPR